ncbi:hypothetical protein E2C01_058658 [Portunus trituberculatus]|uniref:Uncharacterized protein n=1 Tax=Portunus trituberculatus TaxID=210409 RepID=A0A5B7GX39_PORTR|nr:hypothetical protein [Portunus trituberculatus]
MAVHLALNNFSASLALLSHCHQFFLELFQQVLPQPLVMFLDELSCFPDYFSSIHTTTAFISYANPATKFSSLFQSGSLPLASESAIVHSCLAISLDKFYARTPDTNCFTAPTSSPPPQPRKKLTYHSSSPGEHRRDSNRHRDTSRRRFVANKGKQGTNTPQTQADSLREAE